MVLLFRITIFMIVIRDKIKFTSAILLVYTLNFNLCRVYQSIAFLQYFQVMRNILNDFEAAKEHSRSRKATHRVAGAIAHPIVPQAFPQSRDHFLTGRNDSSSQAGSLRYSIFHQSTASIPACDSLSQAGSLRYYFFLFLFLKLEV